MRLQKLVAIAGLCALMSAAMVNAQFSYQSFSGATTLIFPGNGNQAQILNDRLRLVQAVPGFAAGAAYHNTPQYLRSGFDTYFSFQISPGNPNLQGGADGLTFIIARTPMLGGTGFAIGYGGIPHSLVVEFDTYQNYYDPDGNHISVQTRWEEPNSPDHQFSLGWTSYSPDFNNNAVYNIRISYDTTILKVYVNNFNAPVLSVNLQLNDLDRILDSNGYAYVGFTAAKASDYGDHDILSWDFVPEPASLLALGAGLAGLMGLKRRKR